MAKSIMIQGTASNAGKSILTAALCRIFAQDGYKVAPFKSQNMALNSFITKDGLEMGRAQVVQAEAAFREPDVRMNPILIKPTSDCGAQIIVGGEVFSSMKAMDYYEQKLMFREQILKDYNSLSEENDIIVIEGAGSPAEINLKKNDIVNMGMAKMANAPVLLAGDIDRGGVFASLYGTYALLDESEKKHLKAVIINKFRGDKKILQPGVDMLRDLMPVPCIGVVPYMNLKIDDEDSLSSVFQNTSSGDLDIAVVKLPKISNFTDFNAFDILAGVKVRYIENVSEFGMPDLLILPGTKNTLSDLKWLRQSGLEAKIKQYVSLGGAFFGVCGGYQMLCKNLSDPYGVEDGGSMKGLELLEADTVFEEEKTRTRVNGVVKNAQGIFSCLNGKNFEGYEIHMGKTSSSFSMNTLKNGDGAEFEDGMSKGNVCGTYVHGFFDSPEIVHTILNALAVKKGIKYTPHENVDLETKKNREYDKLAELVRESLDMKSVYKILDDGV